MKVHARKNDTVIVVSGRDKGKASKVLRVNPEADKVIVRGVNIAKKYQEPTRANTRGGIIERKGAIYSSKVILYCTEYRSATRISNKILEDGTRVGVCKKYGKTF